MENIEPAETLNVYDGQLECCDQQCQRQHCAWGAARPEDPLACAVKI